MNLSYLLDWRGQPERDKRKVEAFPLAMWLSLLDRETRLESGAAVPPLAHWAIFAPMVRQSEIDVDGHPKRGGFLPPVPLPRRMWAAGRLEFHRPLTVGQEVIRQSEVKSIEGKQGSTGELVFVSVRHQFSAGDEGLITEDQDIVYRNAPQRAAANKAGVAARIDEQFSREVAPDPTLLFRFSAATFNSHRIHYDRQYATEIEGYPGLVVQGPLLATLLVDLLRGYSPSAVLQKFQFKAVAPVFETEHVTLCGRVDSTDQAALWVRNARGLLCMEASAKI